MNTETTIGIDCGVSTCTASLLLGREVYPVSFPDYGQGCEDHMPMAAFVETPSKIVVGKDALPLRTLDPTRYFDHEIKDQLDRSDEIPHPDIAISRARLVAAIIARVKILAERSLHQDSRLDNVVLTVPALCTEHGNVWTALESAARQAGFASVQFLREPEAAALSYSDFLNRNNIEGIEDGDTILVYDMGGGKFDASVVRSMDGRFQLLKSVPSQGLACGGIWIDELLMMDFQAKCPRAAERFHSVDEGTAAEAYGRVADFLLDIKHRFSLPSNDAVNKPDPILGIDAYTLNRNQFHKMIGPMIEGTIRCCESALADVQLNWEDLKHVVLVGGGSNLSLVRERLEDTLTKAGAAPKMISRKSIDGAVGVFDPLLAVSMGAALSRRPPLAPIRIWTPTLPKGVVGVPYLMSMAATGGIENYIWKARALPDGLALSPVGKIQGIPAGPAGTFPIEVSVSDDNRPKPHVGQAIFALEISLPPAEHWSAPPAFHPRSDVGELRLQMLYYQVALSIHHYLTKVVAVFSRKKATTWKMLEAMVSTGVGPSQQDFPMVLRISLRVEWKNHKNVAYSCRVLRAEREPPAAEAKFLESLVPVAVPTDWGTDQMPLEIRRDMIARGLQESERVIYQYTADKGLQ